MPVKLIATPEERLYSAIDSALELADLGGRSTPAQAIAQRIFEGDPELIAEISRPWVIERLTWMIHRRRRSHRDRLRPSGQMMLPDPIFQNLPKTIFLRNGKRPKLLHCNVTQTNDHLLLLKQRSASAPSILQFEAIVELHRKWAAIQKGITLEDAMRREADERGL